MNRNHRSASATRIIPSPVGAFVLTLATDGSLCSHWRDLSELPAARERSHGNSPWLDDVADRLRAYFAGREVPDWSDVPTPDGPPFHRACWEACRRIGHGEVMTYADLAEAAGSPMASRAAGQAMRSNPLSVIVPCHRVVGSKGRLHGYAGTIDGDSSALRIKRGLLELERRSMPVLAGV